MTLSYPFHQLQQRKKGLLLPNILDRFLGLKHIGSNTGQEPSSKPITEAGR